MSTANNHGGNKTAELRETMKSFKFLLGARSSRNSSKEHEPNIHEGPIALEAGGHEKFSCSEADTHRAIDYDYR